jgi:hypothetical protein
LAALVLDGDHLSTDEAVAAIINRVADYRWIVHATHGDRPGDRCVRIVLALSRPATRDEAPAVWAGAVELLGVPVDPTCKDPSRAYYTPSRPRDADYFYARGDGAAIDVDALLSTTSSSTPSSSSSTISRADEPDEARVLRARTYVAEMTPAIQGQRGSDALFRAVCRVMHGFDLDDETTRALIVEHYNPRCQPPWNDREIDHKIVEARNKTRDPSKWRVDPRSNWIEEAKYSAREPTASDLRSDR